MRCSAFLVISTFLPIQNGSSIMYRKAEKLFTIIQKCIKFICIVEKFWPNNHCNPFNSEAAVSFPNFFRKWMEVEWYLICRRVSIPYLFLLSFEVCTLVRRCRVLKYQQKFLRKCKYWIGFKWKIFVTIHMWKINFFETNCSFAVQRALTFFLPKESNMHSLCNELW